MSITVSGLGSGLDYDSWIEKLVAIKQAKIDEVSAKVSAVNTKESTLTKLKSDYSSLLDAITAFTDSLSTNDVFKQKAAKSSSDAVSASVTSGATAQDINVSVSKLATSTVAKSASVAASYVDKTTLVSNIAEGAVTAGSFSVYVNGKKSTIDIASNETVDSVLTKLKGIEGVAADLSSDGKLSISSSDSDTYSITVGSSADTSNFSKVMSLTRDSVSGNYSSSKSIFDTNTGASLMSTPFAGGSITAGNFTIGSTTFTIDSSTTMDSLIAKINKSDAGVNAAWDSNAGKIVLTAKEQGAFNINITAGDGKVGDDDASNFTDIMGLTTSTWTDGKLASTNLNTESQEVGSNAVLKINGTEITSSSNTVTSDISGLTGVTLTLNDKTTTDATVSVSQDTSKVTEAVKKLVDAYNTVITDTDKNTTTSGALYGETILTSLRNKVRTLITSAVAGEDGYKSLANIGITTGKYTKDASTVSSKLEIDTDKLAAALADNPDAVKTMLTGDKTAGTKGVLTDIEKTLDDATDSVKGYFVKRNAAYEKEVDRYEDKIDRMTDSLKKYQERLETKFQAMDTLIANLKKQSSIFDSYFNKSSDSSSSS